MNGVINLSILDGWWDEGYHDDNGWAIGSRDRQPDEGAQDWADAQSLYHLLESEIVPLWYGRDEHGRPAGWLARMRRAIGSALWQFSTSRMLVEYVERMYLPAAAAGLATGSAPASESLPPRRRERAATTG
jgi:starch phosphorylase